MLYVDIEKKLESITIKSKFKHDKGILGFLGESGSGKSMTLKCIAGLEKPTKGKIILNGRTLYDSENNINLPAQERNVGYLFQNYALFPHMTVRENIEIGLKNMDKHKKRNLSKEYLQRFYLDGLENRYPRQLSGGQQQRVALARALITSPEIILLDEPFSALDYHLRSNMEKELINMLNEYNGDIVFVTHDISEAYRVCSDILVYDKGLALNKTDKKNIFENPKTLVEAKITGCKNISRIKKINDEKVFAIDWGYEYNLNCEYENYIGIRNHNISISKDSKYEFTLIDIIENPFNYSLYLKNTNLENSKIIQVDIEKNNFSYKINDKIGLNFEKLFAFK